MNYDAQERYDHYSNEFNSLTVKELKVVFESHRILEGRVDSPDKADEHRQAAKAASDLIRSKRGR